MKKDSRYFLVKTTKKGIRGDPEIFIPWSETAHRGKITENDFDYDIYSFFLLGLILNNFHRYVNFWIVIIDMWKRDNCFSL